MENEELIKQYCMLQSQYLAHLLSNPPPPEFQRKRVGRKRKIIMEDN